MRPVFTSPKTYYFIIRGEKTGNEAEPVRVHTGLFSFCIRFHDTESKIQNQRIRHTAVQVHPCSPLVFSLGFHDISTRFAHTTLFICFVIPSDPGLISTQYGSHRYEEWIRSRSADKIFWFLIYTDSNCVKAGVSLTAETEPNWALFNVEKHALSYMV